MKQNFPQVFVVCLLAYLPPAKLSAQTNLAGGLNPNFENGLTSWSGNGFTNASIDLVNPGEGSKSAKLAAPSSTNTFNTLVSSAMTIPPNSGRSYLLSVSARENLVGGPAWFALYEAGSNGASLGYSWKATAASTNWHSESMIVTPRTNTTSLRVYFKVDPSATAGASWWDSVRLISSMTPATNNPFPSGDLTDLTIDFAPLPVSTFTRGGTPSVFHPSAVVPSANVGTLLVGGTLTWQIVKVVDPPGSPPTVVFQNSMILSATGLCAWTIDLNAISPPLPAGDYLLVINAISRDRTITKNVSKPLSLQ